MAERLRAADMDLEALRGLPIGIDDEEEEETAPNEDEDTPKNGDAGATPLLLVSVLSPKWDDNALDGDCNGSVRCLGTPLGDNGDDVLPLLAAEKDSLASKGVLRLLLNRGGWCCCC